MKLAEATIDESKQAAVEAERLKAEIDSYARQVKTLHTTLNSTSDNLESAQMAVVESKIAEKLEAVRAPATGVVLDIADSSQSVTPGETIIAIGRPDRLEVRFEDTSDAWKTLRIGSQLPAAIQEGTQKTSVLAELQDIEKPKNGSPAVLITAIDNPRQATGGRRFRPGLAVQCSIARPGARQSLSVPSVALWRDTAGQTMVAVLVPTAPQNAPQSRFGISYASRCQSERHLPRAVAHSHDRRGQCFTTRNRWRPATRRAHCVAPCFRCVN